MLFPLVTCYHHATRKPQARTILSYQGMLFELSPFGLSQLGLSPLRLSPSRVESIGVESVELNRSWVESVGRLRLSRLDKYLDPSLNSLRSDQIRFGKGHMCLTAVNRRAWSRMVHFERYCRNVR